MRRALTARLAANLTPALPRLAAVAPSWVLRYFGFRLLDDLAGAKSLLQISRGHLDPGCTSARAN